MKETMWWDDYKIEQTVTRSFVCHHLLPEEIDRLDRSLSFGDGLTDGTYWEWIDEPMYAVRPSAEGLKLGINFILYAMTH